MQAYRQIQTNFTSFDKLLFIEIRVAAGISSFGNCPPNGAEKSLHDNKHVLLWKSKKKKNHLTWNDGRGSKCGLRIHHHHHRFRRRLRHRCQGVVDDSSLSTVEHAASMIAGVGNSTFED